MLLLLATALTAHLETTEFRAPTTSRPTNLSFEVAETAVGRSIAEASRLLDTERYAEALAVLTPVAQAGDVRAQAAVGLLYARGEGTERNLATANHWLTLASRTDSRWRPIQQRVETLQETGDLIRRSRDDARRFSGSRNPHRSFINRPFERYASPRDHGAYRRAVNRNTILSP